MIKDDVTFQRPELTKALIRYGIIRDCIEQSVKSRGAIYLPKPNPTDRSAENIARYDAYLERAIFYGVTGRTLGGMVGQVYARDPDIVVPTLLQPVVDDATGSGLSLLQLSKDSMRDVIALGRGGILTDYPKATGAVTRAQQLRGEVRPTFTIYSPEAIINWRIGKRGGKAVKTLIVLKETAETQGTFSVELVPQYRVLRLVNDSVYRMEIWQERDAATGAANPFVSTASKGKQWTLVDFSEPLDATGFPMTELPFEFIGAINNDATIDEPPLYDLSELNIGHYRNSADYEEASFIVGQPTPWFSGLTEEWVTDVFKGPVLLGSRAAIPLPENSQAGLLQVNPNIMPMEAMKHKEAQMVALGARLVENRAVRRTLGEVQQSNASETSILASCANNVSAAFTQSLVWAARFMGAPTDGIVFKLNTDFALTQMAADERNAIIADIQAGTLSWTEGRTILRRGGVASQDDKTAKAEIDAWLKEAAERDAASKPVPALANKPPQE